MWIFVSKVIIIISLSVYNYCINFSPKCLDLLSEMLIDVGPVNMYNVYGPCLDTESMTNSKIGWVELIVQYNVAFIILQNFLILVFWKVSIRRV